MFDFRPLNYNSKLKLKIKDGFINFTVNFLDNLPFDQRHIYKIYLVTSTSNVT